MEEKVSGQSGGYDTWPNAESVVSEYSVAHPGWSTRAKASSRGLLRPVAIAVVLVAVVGAVEAPRCPPEKERQQF